MTDPFFTKKNNLNVIMLAARPKRVLAIEKNQYSLLNQTLLLFFFMNILIEFLANSGQFIRPWLSEISTAMIACLLVVFGADINRILRRQLSGANFIIRTLVFILVNAFGYGFLIIAVSPWLANQLSHIPSQWLICLVVTTFIFVGTWHNAIDKPKQLIRVTPTY